MPGTGPARKFRRFAALLGALTAVAAAPRPAVCAPPDEIIRRDFGIGGFKAPPRWELQPPDRPMYPQMLAWASRGQGAERAVITLVARRLMPGTSAQAFANESRSLQIAGVRNVRTQQQAVDGWGQRVILDGVVDGPQRRLLRQVYLVGGGFGYVLTLVAPQAQALPRLRDLEDVAGGLVAIPQDPSDRPKVPAPPGPAALPPVPTTQQVTPATPLEAPR